MSFKPNRSIFISPFQDEARKKREKKVQAGEELEFSTTAKLAESLENQPIETQPKGTFKNKTTGQITDAQGNPVDSQGQQVADEVSTEFDTTSPWYISDASDEVNRARQGAWERGELSIDGKKASGFEDESAITRLEREQQEQFKRQQELQKRQQEEQLNLQETLELSALDTSIQRGESAISAVQSQFSAPTAGVQTSTSKQISERFKSTTNKRLQQLQNTFASNQRQRQILRDKLELAQESQNTSQEKLLETQIAQLDVQKEKILAESEIASQEATERAGKMVNQAQESFSESYSPEDIAKIDGTTWANYAENIASSQGFTPEQTANFLNFVGGQKLIADKIATAPDEEKAPLIEQLQGLKGLSGETAEIGTKLLLNEAIRKAKKSGDTARADMLKELSADIGGKEKAKIEKINAETAKINNEISPTYSGTGSHTIDINSIGTGSALPLNTLGDSSKSLRTDRHNNPTANKAYKTTIDRLTKAGLIKGVDFEIGETTKGIDDDGVATIMYKDAETGTLGTIETLKAGEIGSWYANSAKYGGSSKVISALQEFSSDVVSTSNAQEVFNNLNTEEQTEIVKTIYGHEGGNQLFTSDLSSSQQLEAAKISAEIFGKAGGASSRPENLSKVENLMKEGLSADDIRDRLRMGEQSEEFSGSIRDAAESISINLGSGKSTDFFNSLDRMLAEGNTQGAKEQIKRAARASAGVDEAKIVAGSERTLEFINEISDDLNAFSEKGGDTGIFTGTTEKMFNKVGRTTDPDLAKVATKIAKAIQSYRRSMSGVAFSVPESEEYKGIFPSIDKIDEFNLAKIDALNDIMQGDVDFFYKNAMGETAYKDIFEGGALDKVQNDLTTFNLQDTGEQAKFTEVQNKIQELIDEGESDDEIEAELIRLGIDPNQFL
jgi:hypothetical protein